jgi:hypothetical protein
MDIEYSVVRMKMEGMSAADISSIIDRSTTTTYKILRGFFNRYEIYKGIAGPEGDISDFIASEEILGKQFYIDLKNKIKKERSNGVIEGREQIKAKTVHFTMIDSDEGLKRVISIATGDGDNMLIDYPDEAFWQRVDAEFALKEMPHKRKRRLLRAV